MTSPIRYVHGYTPEELARLSGSAATLESLIHQDTRYPEGALVLEPGCGVGAQTRVLRERCPGMRLVSVDIARKSLLAARAGNDADAQFVQADIHRLPFRDGAFDHLFICWVLEHLPDPLAILKQLRRLLAPGGTITLIEGDHGSAFFHPETEESLAAWRCLQRLQQQGGGDGHIGRRLYSLLRDAGSSQIQVKLLPVYCDPTHPEMMTGFVDKTIVGMLRGIEDEVLAQGMLPPEVWRRGIDDLLHLAESDRGTFMYAFFRATAVF